MKNNVPLLDRFSDEEFEKIVKDNFCYADIMKDLGYNSKSGSSYKALKEKINKLNISTEHFTSKKGIERNEENIFIENSTADQSTLRKYYLKGNYTPYICLICGQEPIWQEKPMTLILDHINGNNKDDRLENLRWVCPNCNQQLDTTNGKNKKHKEHELKYCIDCGKVIGKKSIRCLSCSSKKIKEEQAKELPITREELKKLIRTTPFTKIGELYNLSDNSIRKWCKKVNLPFKTSDIKKYSNEEWEKI